jgi:hypothetical protein
MKEGSRPNSFFATFKKANAIVIQSMACRQGASFTVLMPAAYQVDPDANSGIFIDPQKCSKTPGACSSAFSLCRLGNTQHFLLQL